MHVPTDLLSQLPSAARLTSSSADRVVHVPDIKWKKVESTGGLADPQIAPTSGGGGSSSPAIPAAPEKSTQAKLRPEAPADRRFSPQTLDALIKSQAGKEAAAQRILADIDADGDGGFTLAELKDALPGKSGEAPGRAARAERLFGRIDADEDGKVTLAELTALFAPKPVEPAEEEAAAVETAAAGTTSEVIDAAKPVPSA